MLLNSYLYDLAVGKSAVVLLSNIHFSVHEPLFNIIIFDHILCYIDGILCNDLSPLQLYLFAQLICIAFANIALKAKARQLGAFLQLNVKTYIVAVYFLSN